MTGTVQHNLGFYVYCVAESVAARQLDAGSLPTAIEEDTKLEWVTGNDLAALASRVPLESYGEEALAEHLADATWTAVRAMRHETVVEYVAKRASVAPLRFGTIYLERAGIERMLAEKSRELTQIIERLRGREEWGVNVYADRTTLMASITSLSPRLREMAQQAEAASPGQSYLMQKKIEAMRVDEARVALNNIIESIETKLSEQADDAKRLRILKVEATEYGELKGKFAFLVKRSEFEQFREAAERVAEEHLAAGVRLELTGPWPAYNFTVFDGSAP
ncbi:MAG TPA: GvpL/GvpF family gas vesicle protein [Pyrinomonadaceae bacterium]|nr:GvpL/GvpF family gas vesicle protein [Pyrinomonadaceae bacterium]